MLKRKLHLNWQGYFLYSWENVDRKVPNTAGVYKISFLQKNGKLRVRYVGQADDLSRRLKDHLDTENEPNECLAGRLEKYHSEFQFAEVGRQENRDGAERALYLYYRPLCNDPDAIPNGPDLEINPR